MNLTAILGVCIIAAILAVILRENKYEYAIILSLVAGAVIFLSLLDGMLNSFFEIRNIISEIGIDSSYFITAFKALGVCIITGFTADLCRDFGQTALAGRAELAGRCAIFLISLPLISSLLEAAYSFIGN
ncbi:MAG: stage III sporulation protein AD [Clostridia bacterium]|nr:stage III sporulation protein AD [Clostridia bacterium]